MKHSILAFVLFWSVLGHATSPKLDLSFGQSELDAPTNSISASAHFRVYSFNADRGVFSIGPRLTRVSRYFRFRTHPEEEPFLDGLSLTALNLMIALDHQIGTQWLAGFNLDLLGFGFGAEQQHSPSGANVLPTRANLFLIGNNDRGFLSSEFFLGYQLTKDVLVRSGLSHQVVEYEPPAGSSRRIQKFYNLFFVAVGITLPAR